MNMNYQTRFIYEKVINDNRVKSILNIGYRYDSDSTLLSFCLANKQSWTVLEVFENNVDSLRQRNIETYHMDVLNIKQLDKQFDAIIWLHGPEHISWDQFLNVRQDIEEKSNVITIYQAPIGEYPQDEMYGNPYEKHITTLYPNMFLDLGYNVLEHTQEGESTFSAWKY